ncbi:tyrosine-type recombinase/integrase [Novosphingobium humi]|uniref:tyrosine-type recombinase/integrase n=1 Tax=Novosphingobium humi TaxID=2282397 RepID=UPI0025AF3782|nr:hypothetical protein [Novosphingobium humi]WJS97767.1 hypothetical protein NYQ05_11525 [Novosphingobium humi]
MDPSRIKKQQAADTFKAIAQLWHRKRKDLVSENHADRIMRSLENGVFPIIGHLPIVKIGPAHILQVLNLIEERRAFDQAHRIRQRMSDIFVFAIASGLAETDPAVLMRNALRPIPKGNYPAPQQDRGSTRTGVADANMAGWPQTKLASRLMAITDTTISKRYRNLGYSGLRVPHG